MKLVTKYDPRFDWSCYDDDSYAPGMPLGQGRTELEAIADWLIQHDLPAADWLIEKELRK